MAFKFFFAASRLRVRHLFQILDGKQSQRPKGNAVLSRSSY